MNSSAKKWDDGCKTDNTRNCFVVPKLVQLINEFNPKRILDIGTGTGYIVRAVDALVNVSLHWNLIDMDDHRIEFVENNMPASVSFQVSRSDFTKDEIDGGPFDMVLVLFTLLELNLELKLFSQINQLTLTDGLVVIAMPDSLEDVLKAAVNTPSLLEDFVEGRCVLSKTDKFTDETYPFKAHRFENIVQLMLYSNFCLDKMYSYNHGDNETYMLAFRKNGDLK